MSSAKRLALGLGLAAFLAVPLSSCATPPPEDDPEALAAYEETNDPLEPFNRAVFEFNRYFDSFVLKPIAVGYRTIVPEFFRERVHTGLQTAAAPVVFANDLLQGKLERAGITFGRTLVNLVLGAGIFDAATDIGLEYHDEDFGQTLAVWGVDEGAYLMVPVIGPTTLRDGAGMVADIFIDPWTYIFDTDKEVLYARAGLTAADTRERNLETIENLEKTSVDFYAAIRSLYRQHRDDAIRDGELPPVPPVPGARPSVSGDVNPELGPAPEEMAASADD